MSHPARRMQREQLRQARKDSEAMIRSQQVLQAPPQTAGAVDLNTMKGDKAAQQAMADQQMQKGGFLCSCGARMQDQSIAVMGYNLGRFPVQTVDMTPRGPVQKTILDDGCQFFMQTFCSRQCIEYLDTLKNGIDPGEEARAQGIARPRVRAIRNLPAIEWIDDSPSVEIAA